MSRVERAKPSPRTDRAIAWVIWTISGTLAGVAIGIFTGDGVIFTLIGLVLGLILGWRRTRPQHQIEQD